MSLAKFLFKAHYRAPVETRFWDYVNKDGPKQPKIGKCWLWIGGTFSSGYGQFNNKIEKRSHRFSYQLHFGPIPIGKDVLHKCDNPRCVNPTHLFLGNPQINMADKVAKKRQAVGEKVHCSRLTTSQVIEIRRRYKKRDKVNGRSALAKEFGVYEQAIEHVVKRKTWKHI